jgi:hypothetical protein
VRARAPGCKGDNGALDRRDRERAEGAHRHGPIARPLCGGARAMADSDSHLNASGCKRAHGVEDVEAEHGA